jgi:DNA repair protein RadC
MTSDKDTKKTLRRLEDSEQMPAQPMQISLFGPPITAHPSAAPKTKPVDRGSATLDDEDVAAGSIGDDTHKGHRQRMRARFRKGGSDALHDYELLEMILFHAFPRKDTKPIAKRLLADCGSFAEVINASRQRLSKIDGVGERAIDELHVIRAAAVLLTKGHVRKRDTLASWQAVLDYLKAAQGYDDKEAFRILFLDKRNNLIADEVQQRGTVDHTPVYVREVMGRALELAATAIILVHNHPSGDPTPSRADIDMTKLISAAGAPLGVSVHDHIIVGRHGHVSMKSMRLI